MSHRDSATPVHPHRRGDGIAFKCARASVIGSPPQAWGRHPFKLVALAMKRFTPTGVGTAGNDLRCPRKATVHPHRRGDGRIHGRCVTDTRGSPPQAWGRPPSQDTTSRALRFTPTGVGTASSGVISSTSFAVHPHRRGDGPYHETDSAVRAGSPPQAWGRHARHNARSSVSRFTPTGVGTATCSTCAATTRTVHPHRRGDGRSTSSTLGLATGSPPQAWGRQLANSTRIYACRFTPTGVGTA